MAFIARNPKNAELQTITIENDHLGVNLEMLDKLARHKAKRRKKYKVKI